MDGIQKLLKVVNTDIPFIEPKKLKEMSYGLTKKEYFPDIKTSFEFPPKSLGEVIELFFSKSFEKLNFFDITRMLIQLELDNLSEFVNDKSSFCLLFVELYKNTEKYIQKVMMKITAKIFLNNKHSFYKQLNSSLILKEFTFLKLCIEEDYNFIYREIGNQSLKMILESYNIYKLLIDLNSNYGWYLIKNLDVIKISSDNYLAYLNNTLDPDNLKILEWQLSKLLTYIEKKENPDNNKYLDMIISNKLGDLNDKNSGWYKFAISDDLVNRYKKLKGLFEFQKFIDIAEYLSEHTDLKYSNLSNDGKTSDAKRILNRSAFWSNYDERFESVEMWVSSEDYEVLSNSGINLNRVKQLKDINNEMCVFYFENMIIINFFRRDNIHKNLRYNSENRKRLDTLVFVENNKNQVKDILNNHEYYSIDLNNKIHDLANFIIKYEIFLWQGWVDQFLREFNIFPNLSVINGKKFISAKDPMIKDKYDIKLGLNKSRQMALEADRPSKYEDVIRILNYEEFNKKKFETPFDEPDDIEKLAIKIYNWILEEFEHRNRLNLSYDYLANIRVKDESKKIAKELLKKGKSSINLPFLMQTNSGPIHFSVDNIRFETIESDSTTKCSFKNIEKVRVYELAKELNIESSEIIRIASSLNIEITSHQNTLTQDQVIKIKQYFDEQFDDSYFTKRKKESEKNKKIQIINPEISQYSKYIQTIENINFEKIRRHCENLVKSNQADEMQKYLAENGKMYKALIYDALEQFIENLNGKAITLIDWGSGQGIGTMLVLDYIKEKQLDITIDQVFLLNEISDKKILNRAFDNTSSLKQLNTNIYTSSLITCDPDNLILASDNNVLNILNNCKNDNLLHLFVNDVIPFDLFTFDSEFDTAILTGYFLCVSNNNIETINYLVQQIRSIGDINNITERVGKIGRFERYERVFNINDSLVNYEHNIPTIDIDDDEIPF